MSLSSFSRRRLLALAGGAALSLAGCGRKADPKPPPDADPSSPRTYPAPRRLPSDERATPPGGPVPGDPDPVRQEPPPPSYR